MSDFKKGDRVRQVDSTGPLGTITEVTSFGNVFVAFDGQQGGSLWWQSRELAHAEPALAPFKRGDKVEHVDNAPGFVMTVAADQFTSGSVEVTDHRGRRYDFQAKFLKHAEPATYPVRGTSEDPLSPEGWEVVDRAVKALSEDVVNSPSHYTAYPVEVIELTEHMNFNRGNAVKYIARAGLKDKTKEAEDLAKAAWYINREIDRLAKETA